VFTGEFPIPTSGVNVGYITSGPDGNLWFTENGSPNPPAIGRTTPSGVITEFAAPDYQSGLTSGPDGNLWVTESSRNGVAKVSIGPLYHVCLLYDPTKAAKSGSTIPIKLQICDGSGNDLSSSSITVHAVGLTQVSSSITGPVEDSGNANPDYDFRFDSTLGSTGGYIFNLKTTGLSTGTYNLNFTVTGDSFVYATPFQVK
jgi:hypothetical protein